MINANLADQVKQTQEFFALWNSDKKQEAIQVLLSLAKKYPDNPAALVLAAEFVNEIGGTESSDEYIQRAIELDPKDEYSYTVKAKMLAERGMLHTAFELMSEAFQKPITGYMSIEKAAMTYQKYGLLEMAEKAYLRGFEVFPDHEGFWHGYAKMYKDAYMFDKYLEVLQTAVKKRPNDAHLWSELGITAGNLGKNEAAWDALETTQKLVQDDVEGSRKLGLLYQAVGQYDRAEEYLRKSVQKDDKNIHSWAYLALLLKLKGDEKGAKDAFGRAEKIDKRHHDALRHMSEKPPMKSEEIVFAQNAESKFREFLDMYKARQDIKVLVSKLSEIHILVRGAWLINGSLGLLEPSLVDEVLVFIGGFLAGRQDTDKALGAMYRALVRSPNDINVWLNMGEVLFRNQKPHGAHEAYKRALSLDPSNAEIKRVLGLVSVNLDDFGDAIAYLEDAYSADPSKYDMLRGLAYSYLNTGDYKKTKEFCAKALGINTSDANVYGFLVLAEQGLGNSKASDEALRMCQKLDKGIATEYEKARASMRKR